MPPTPSHFLPFVPLLHMDRIMALDTKAHEVVEAVVATLCYPPDVMHQGRGGHNSLLPAPLTQRMLSQLMRSDLGPCSTIPALGSRPAPAILPLILSTLMLGAVPAITDQFFTSLLVARTHRLLGQWCHLPLCFRYSLPPLLLHTLTADISVFQRAMHAADFP